MRNVLLLSFLCLSLCTVSSAAIAQSGLQSTYDVDGAIAQIRRDYPLFGLIFDRHGEAEREFRTAIAAARTPQEAQTSLLKISNRVIGRYAQVYMPLASDKAIDDYLAHTLLVMEHLKDAPQKCATYSLGARGLQEGDLTPALLKRELEIKQAIIASGIKAPVKRPPAPDTLMEKFKDAYLKDGNRPGDLSLKPDVLRADAVRACYIGRETVQALLTLSSSQTAQLYVTMINSGRSTKAALP